MCVKISRPPSIVRKETRTTTEELSIYFFFHALTMHLDKPIYAVKLPLPLNYIGLALEHSVQSLVCQ